MSHFVRNPGAHISRLALVLVALCALPIAVVVAAACAFVPWTYVGCFDDLRKRMDSVTELDHLEAFDAGDGTVAMWFAPQPYKFTGIREQTVRIGAGELHKKGDAHVFVHTVPDDWGNRGETIAVDAVANAPPHWFSGLAPMRPLVPTCTYDVTGITSGWPCASMFLWTAQEYNPGAHGSVQFGGDGGARFGWSRVGFIPTIPIPQGWILNTLFWWPLAFVVTLGIWRWLRMVRGLIWRLRGRCANCGYPRAGLQTSAPCPECGVPSVRGPVHA